MYGAYMYKSFQPPTPNVHTQMPTIVSHFDWLLSQILHLVPKSPGLFQDSSDIVTISKFILPEDEMKKVTCSLIPGKTQFLNVARRKAGGPDECHHVMWHGKLNSCMNTGQEFNLLRPHHVMTYKMYMFTGPSHFSACNTEKLGVTWGQG